MTTDYTKIIQETSEVNELMEHDDYTDFVCQEKEADYLALDDCQELNFN